MIGITLRNNCLICGDKLIGGLIYVCERDEDSSNLGRNCITSLPDNIFNVPSHIPQTQNEQYSARLIIKHRERIMNDNSINR